MDSKKAILAGASGLTGSFLLKLLIEDPDYSAITVLSRRELSIAHPKIREVITDFKNESVLKDAIKGEVFFCCLGTTIRKAGSQEAFRKVDLELPVKLAQLAKENGVNLFLVISSIGADANSGNFYLRTKGEMEQAVAAIQFKTTVILRPSLLMGKREEQRLGESFGKIILGSLASLMKGPLKKYRPIHARTVAKAMLAYSKSSKGYSVISSSELQEMARARQPQAS